MRSILLAEFCIYVCLQRNDKKLFSKQDFPVFTVLYLVCETDEAILGVIRLHFRLEGGESDLSDPRALVGGQLVLAARLESGQDKELELVLGSNENAMWQIGRFGRAARRQVSSVRNRDTVSVEDLKYLTLLFYYFNELY